MSKQAYITDEELAIVLWDYDDLTYDKLPSWIQSELQARRMVARPPTTQEISEAEDDAKYHRLTHNERNVQDFKDKYLNKGK